LNSTYENESVKKSILRLRAPIKGALKALKMGHCAPSVMVVIQDLLGEKDAKTLKCTSAMPGGISWMGAECGCVTSPLMFLGIRYGNKLLIEESGEISAVIHLGRKYLHKFNSSFGGLQCKNIARLDFNDPQAVKKRMLSSYVPCFRAICKAPTMLADLMNEDLIEASVVKEDKAIERYSNILAVFGEQQFHCTHSLLHQFGDVIDVDENLLHLSCAFIGGTLFQGMTCGALTGGVLIIGLKFGMIEDSYLRVMRWMVHSLLDGDIKREDLNKFNKALNIGYELAMSFKKEFGDTNCYKLTKINFLADEGVEKQLVAGKLDNCRVIVDRTANLVRDIIQKYE